MDIIHNLRLLEEIDDETAVTIIQLTLEDLNQLFAADQATAQQGTNSGARRTLERQRDELQRQLRRRGGIPVRGSGSEVAQSIQETANRTFQQEIRQNLGNDEPAASTQKIPGSWPSPPLPTSRLDGVIRGPVRAGPHLTCQICMDDFDAAEVLTLSCSHHCCSECLNEIYQGATTDESRYPPRCCAGYEIDVNQSRPLLNVQILRAFLDKAAEWETRNRTYCSNRNCATFIRPETIRGNDARCTRCRARTCADCKKTAHDANIPCATDEELQGALRLLDRNRWRRCEGCRNGIERTHGCNHMICPCGRQFCYQCGLPWRTCQCPLFPDEIAADQDQPAVPRQPTPLSEDEMEQILRNIELTDEDQFVLNGEIQDPFDDKQLAPADQPDGDDIWQDINYYESEALEIEDPFIAEIDRRHEQELEQQRQRRERASEKDRQRQIAQDLETAHWRDQIQTLRGRMSRLRTQSTALHAGPRLSRSGRRALKEVDDEISEMWDQIMAMELQLEEASDSKDKITRSTLLTATPLMSWNKNSGYTLSPEQRDTPLLTPYDSPVIPWDIASAPHKSSLSVPKQDRLARWDAASDTTKLVTWENAYKDPPSRETKLPYLKSALSTSKKDDSVHRWDKSSGDKKLVSWTDANKNPLPREIKSSPRSAIKRYPRLPFAND